MNMLRSFLFKLGEPYGYLHVSETEDGQGVEFICDGNFILDREQAAKLSDLINPISYSRERIHYQPRPGTEEDDDEAI